MLARRSHFKPLDASRKVKRRLALPRLDSTCSPPPPSLPFILAGNSTCCETSARGMRRNVFPEIGKQKARPRPVFCSVNKVHLQRLSYVCSASRFVDASLLHSQRVKSQCASSVFFSSIAPLDDILAVAGRPEPGVMDAPRVGYTPNSFPFFFRGASRETVHLQSLHH